MSLSATRHRTMAASDLAMTRPEASQAPAVQLQHGDLATVYHATGYGQFHGRYGHGSAQAVAHARMAGYGYPPPGYGVPPEAPVEPAAEPVYMGYGAGYGRPDLGFGGGGRAGYGGRFGYDYAGLHRVV
eukprot:TRINITY_DN857_c0_g1_i2.p1 TRINITY_DN857_c0_g1~~TRINITY_DN857_c0_g1_i2.p1  ORF type:complete len:129 (-),score=15.54 TRINITY_DN857_c0_g1_i2:223-609(-)